MPRVLIFARRATRLSLVVLDVMIPPPDGLEVCRRLRAHFETPIILLTARAEEADRIVGPGANVVLAARRADRLELWPWAAISPTQSKSRI